MGNTGSALANVDPNAAQPDGTQSDNLDALAAQMMQDGSMPDMPAQRPVPMRAVVSAAAATNPDAEAKTQKLAMQAAMPVDLTRANPQAAQQRAAKLDLERRNIEFTNPILSRQLQDPNFAAVAHDDLDSLSRIEQGAAKLRVLAGTEAQSLVAGSDLGFFNAFKPLVDATGDFAQMAVPAIAQSARALATRYDWGNLGQQLRDIWTKPQTSETQAVTDAVEKTLQAGVIQGGRGRQLVNSLEQVPGMLAAFGLTGKLTGAGTEAAGADEVTQSAVEAKSIPTILGTEAAQSTYAAARAKGADQKTAVLSALAAGVSNYALMGEVPGAEPSESLPGLAAKWAGRSVVMGSGMTAAENLVARNYDPSRKWYEGIPQSIATMAAFEGVGALGQIADAAEASKLRKRSPEAFQAHAEAQAEDNPSVRVPAQDFVNYFQGKNIDPAAAAHDLGVSNLEEAATAGSDLEIPAAKWIAMEPEHQKGLLPDVVDPGVGMTMRQAQAGRQELQDWIDSGGAAKLQAEYEQADAETQATPEWKSVYSELKQRYVDAGEKENAADNYATLQANAIANLAKQAGMKADELLALHNPRIVAGEEPGAVLHQGRAPITLGEQREGSLMGEPDSVLHDVYQGGKKVAVLEAGIDGENADIRWLGDEDLGSSLSNGRGPEGLGQIARAFAEQHPDVNTLRAIRGGGARGEDLREVHFPLRGEDGEVLHQAARIERLPGKDGKETTLLTHARELPAQYRLVEADALKPSHNAHTFAKNPDYPEGVQERAYDTSKEAQARVIEQAQRYDPRYTVNSNPDAVNGPPVITPDGTVLGGNSRAMSTQRMYAGGGDAYKAALREQAAAYGFTPEQVDQMQKPVLVREVGQPASADDARRLATELNKSMTGALGVSERAVSAGKNIKSDTLRNISDRMQADDLTLREAMARHGAEIVRMLVGDGAIAERERPQFVDAATGGLSEEGKTFVERALMGSVIDDPRLMDAAPKSVLGKLERSLGSIASFAHRRDEWNLLPVIREAIGELGSIQREGSSVDLRLGQTAMFGGERNPVADAMIRTLDGKPTAVRKAFEEFAKDADQNQPGQPRMFGEANAFDAFNHAFGSTLTDQEYHDGLRQSRQAEPETAASEPAAAENASHDEGVSERASGDEGAGDAGRRDEVGSGAPTTGRADRVAEAPARSRGWFRMRTDGGYEIGKTKIGDMSTLIHEPAHAYLELFRDLSARENASEGIKDDFKKITEWLGTTPEEARANGFTREQHEKWARANEQYVREGKAPSAGLRRAFHNFAVWLGSIYQRATDLNVEVSPEIRGVMDRLYAGENAVDRAERQTGEPLFKSPEEAGWTEEQYRNYADAHGIAVDKAREQVAAEMNAAAEREKTQQFREEKNNVRDAVTEQIDARPEYTAIRSLRRGKLDDGTEMTLSRQALVDQFGEDRVKALQKLHPGLYRQEGGVDADTAAELFGFHSGEEMLRAMEAAPRRNAAIEAATRDFLVNKYGDVRYDGTLEDRARVAVENDERAANLYRELRALKTRLANIEKKAADTKAAMAAITMEPLEHYEAAAHAMIESKAIKDIQPYRYLNASRKFSRDAFEAAGKGNVRRAFEAKTRELLNHFLFREAVEAHEYAGKFESYAKRMQSRGVQQRMGLAGSDTRDQFNWLLARYKLGGGPEPARSLRDWADEMYGDTYEPAISPTILDGTGVKDYRGVPLSEVRELHEALRNIRHLAQMQYKVYINGKMEDFAERRTALVNQAREQLPSKPAPVLEKETKLGRLLRNVQGLAVGSTRMEFLINKLDGGTRGPWHDIIWNPYENAKGDEEALQHQFTQAVNDHVEAETLRQGLHLMDKVMVDGIPPGETVTRKDLVSMALNMGNAGNLDRLRRSFLFHGWNPEAIPKIAGMLTHEEWSFVQNIWDSLKPYGERMMELEKRQTGLPPKMVKVEPFTVHFDDGTTKDLAGGYYPIQIDPRYSLKGYEEDAGKAARNLMETGYGRATTSRGYTKERTGFGGPLLLDYERVLSGHIAKVTKDLSHREWMQTTNKMFTDLEVRQALRETLGPQYEKDFMPFLRAAVNDRNGSLDRGDNDIRPLIETLRSNLINASLGFKASTSLLQLTHLPRILLFTRPGSFTQAMVDFWKDPAGTTAAIRELSPNEMRFRGENLDRDYKTALEEVAKKKGAVAATKRFGLASLKYADHAISFPLWLSVYRDALAKNIELPDARAHELAMHDADAAVRMGVGTGTTGDLPPVMRRSDWGSRLETMLYGFHNLNYNILRYKVGASAASEYRAGNTAAAAGKLTAGMALAWLVPALVSSAVSGNAPKDGENIGDWAAKRSLFFAAGTLPILKDIGSMVEYGSLNPMVNVLKRAVEAGQKTFADKADKDWTGLGIDWLQLGGDVTGVPGTNQAAQTARYVHRAAQGKIAEPTIMGAVVGGGHK